MSEELMRLYKYMLKENGKVLYSNRIVGLYGQQVGVRIRLQVIGKHKPRNPPKPDLVFNTTVFLSPGKDNE